MSKLRTSYNDSHALLIGIDAYEKASPLGYAVSDATAVADALKSNFAFPESNVRLLTNDAASRDAIMEAFLGFALDKTDVNDRLFFFFAGHGLTIRSNRGEIGYLVPHNGDCSSLSTLIRWDDLTRNADLIHAKHILFVMDACYGGLAITRALQPGAMRFVKNMLLRPARQVITAGKADELVADSGGPRADHSVFTGHLLDALDGAAKTGDSLITANGVMAYVYQNVSHDNESEQTPHFGYVTGDGDFIFRVPEELETNSDDKTDDDILVSVPAVATEGIIMTKIDQAKEYLADEKQRIRLHDVVSQETRAVLAATSEDNFPVSGSWSEEEFLERLTRYENLTSDLTSIQAILGYWGQSIHQDVLTLAPKRISGRLTISSGLTAWLGLRWYPILLLIYNGGIGAVAAGRYENLKALLLAPAPDRDDHRKATNLTVALNRGLSDLRDVFKTLPGHERQYVPQSEYLFKRIQPQLDDLLFLGSDYEQYFDQFEILFSLVHAQSAQYGTFLGRFAWKFSSRGADSPFYKLIAEADEYRDTWPPLQAGLFGGSHQTFTDAANKLTGILKQLHW
jgi:hypothetical protein